MNTILCGEVESLPILLKIASKTSQNIVGVAFSKKNSDEEIRKFLTASNLTTTYIFSSSNFHELQRVIELEQVTLLLSFSFDFILPEEILQIQGLKCINVHGGRLPDYRGSNVINWAVINGEKKVAISFHLMSKKVDAGPVIYSKQFRVKYYDTSFTLKQKMIKFVAKTGHVIIQKFLSGEIQPVSQLEESAKVYKKRKESQGEIDWGKSSWQIYNLVRASVYPWPGAFYFDSNGRKVVFKSRVGIFRIWRLKKRAQAVR